MVKFCLLALLSLSALPCVALADVAAAINDVRLHGCNGNRGAASKLRENALLDEAARRLARGQDLRTAAEKAGYRAVTSASVQITNVPDDGDIERIVARQFCTEVTGTTLRDIGTYRHGQDIWLVVAAPFLPPAPSERGRISRRVLDLTNEARSHARRCGSVAFPAAPPLTLAPVLELAAQEHSRDMAAHNYMDHTGRDGSTPADRVTRTGYKWLAIGENLASGTMTPEQAVNGWVGSPHHCENLMDSKFSQMAVAYAVNTASSGGIYWTQVFGKPQ